MEKFNSQSVEALGLLKLTMDLRRNSIGKSYFDIYPLITEVAWFIKEVFYFENIEVLFDVFQNSPNILLIGYNTTSKDIGNLTRISVIE